MDRRAFALGAAALAAAAPGLSRAQTAEGYAPPEPPALPEEFQLLQNRMDGRPLTALRLDQKLDLLPRVPGTLVDVRALGLSRSGWTFFDDRGVFAALFGDGLDDETLTGLVRVVDSPRPSASFHSRATAPFALPTGFVAQEALTRYAYISGAPPAAGGTLGDYAVALSPADTAEVLMARLRAAQRYWASYIERYGAAAVNRL
jgi:hypothetical protein